MQKTIVAASLLLALLPACKKSSSSSAPATSSAASSSSACPVDLSLFGTLTAPANVPASQMNQLGLSFSVQSVQETSGTTSFNLSITPNPIVAWSGMPDNLKGRLADFPRVSICDQSNNCVAYVGKQIVSQKGGTFDFPLWSGVVGIPSNMSGTLTFKASSCTVVRDGSGNVIPAKAVCSSFQTPSNPATMDRPQPASGAANVALQQSQLQFQMFGLGNTLVTPAQNYVNYVANMNSPSQAEQALSKMAQVITYNPYQFGGYLASPAYADAIAQLQAGTSSSSSSNLGLASTNPCTSTGTGSGSGGTLVNNPNGTLIGTTVTVTSTVTQTSPGVVTTVTNTGPATTLTKTDTTTVVTLANPQFSIPLQMYKIRVLNSTGAVLSCVQLTTKGVVQTAPCDDSIIGQFQWTLVPVTSLPQGAFQISAQLGGKCLEQSSSGVIADFCNTTNQAQIFQFDASKTLITAPTIGGKSSSLPYMFVGYQGGAVANCINLSGTGLVVATGTAPSCTTAFSIDTLAEPSNLMKTYENSLGIQPGNSLIGEIGTSMFFSGVFLGCVGLVMVGAEAGHFATVYKTQESKELGFKEAFKRMAAPKATAKGLTIPQDTNANRANVAGKGFLILSALTTIAGGTMWAVAGTNPGTALASSPEQVFTAAIMTANSQLTSLDNQINALP